MKVITYLKIIDDVPNKDTVEIKVKSKLDEAIKIPVYIPFLKGEYYRQKLNKEYKEALNYFDKKYKKDMNKKIELLGSRYEDEINQTEYKEKLIQLQRIDIIETEFINKKYKSCENYFIKKRKDISGLVSKIKNIYKLLFEQYYLENDYVISLERGYVDIKRYITNEPITYTVKNFKIEKDILDKIDYIITYEIVYKLDMEKIQKQELEALRIKEEAIKRKEEARKLREQNMRKFLDKLEKEADNYFNTAYGSSEILIKERLLKLEKNYTSQLEFIYMSSCRSYI